MINPQKPVINPIKIFNRFTALIKIQNKAIYAGEVTAGGMSGCTSNTFV